MVEHWEINSVHFFYSVTSLISREFDPKDRGISAATPGGFFHLLIHNEGY